MEEEESKTGIVDLCALFPFINHDNNVLKGLLCIFSNKAKRQKHVILSYI